MKKILLSILWFMFVWTVTFSFDIEDYRAFRQWRTTFSAIQLCIWSEQKKSSLTEEQKECIANFIVNKITAENDVDWTLSWILWMILWFLDEEPRVFHMNHNSIWYKRDVEPYLWEWDLYKKYRVDILSLALSNPSLVYNISRSYNLTNSIYTSNFYKNLWIDLRYLLWWITRLVFLSANTQNRKFEYLSMAKSILDWYKSMEEHWQAPNNFDDLYAMYHWNEIDKYWYNSLLYYAFLVSNKEYRRMELLKKDFKKRWLKFNIIHDWDKVKIILSKYKE